MKTIPINNGFYNCKSIDNKIFKSRYIVSTFGNIGCGGDTLHLDNKTYIVGEGKPSFKRDKTNNEATKIFVLNMLSKFTDTSEHFNVILTSPPLSYSYQKMLLPRYLIGKYNLVYNGQSKEIYIDNVAVYPETIMAYIANNPQRFKRPVIILDVGGITTNAIMIKNGIYSKDDIVSFSNGMYHLEYSIKQLFDRDYYDKVELSPDDIPRILVQGLYLPGSMTNIVSLEKANIDNIFKSHIDKIIDTFEYKGWNANVSDILVTGDGGKILFDTIKNCYYPQAVLSYDPIFDNLRGLELMAKRSA